jgi:DNA repair exonuclease SbcCD ATPase subunit
MDTQRQNSHLKKIAEVILFLVMIALTVYVLSLQHQNFNILFKSTDLALTDSDHATANYRTYVGRYKETKIELDETTQKLEVVNRQLDQVAAELATTKGALSQTRGMLSEAQEENTKLKQELQGLDDLRNTENVQNIGELQAKIQALKDKDSQISLQLAQLKSEMRAFAAEFSNSEEGRSLIVLFQNKIKLVKNRIRHLKQEAFFAKVTAQKEKDRRAVLNGNSGFIVRNGQAQNPNGTNKSFAIDVKIVP